ncbi:MAG: bacterial Ig-like domain-containing protein, partial [Firmicutes bacterium]|nr:bacterial Ig-like domain-containing protein [Bacillota bacterium]
SVSYTYSYGSADTYTREMETLDRGLVAVKTSNGVYLSWRLLDSEDAIFGSADSNVSFDIYRDGEYLATESDTTNYVDASGTTASTYSVVPSGESTETTISIDENDKTQITVQTQTAGLTAYAAKYTDDGTLESVAKFDVDKTGTSTFTAGFEADKAYLWDEMKPVEGTIAGDVSVLSNSYFDIELDVPDSVTLADGVTYSYSPNDASCGDLDGDGEYEIVVKWDCNGQDNSNSGYTGNVYLDAYKLDGTMLWRIDLGQNIRAGAHYTQFLVYDFDGDGCAEVTAKTAPGSKDNSGSYVTAASHVDAIAAITDSVNETSYVNDGGYILSGDEYFTIFNGVTGDAEDTIYYPNQRVAASVWGDTYGNRCDRFTATVAYLDGTTPYAVYMRGYYMRQSGGSGERQAACAISFDGETLDCEYSFDTYNVSSYSSKSSSASYDSSKNYKGVDGYVSGNEIYVGEGNHNCTVADVDNDGCDEVITGALCYKIIDGRLSPLWCTFLEHGDALHIGDYDPTHDGFEFFTVHEDGGGTNSLSGTEVTLDYGMSVIDAATGEIMFHAAGSKDTGRGVMANTGAGGYYQVWSAQTSPYQSNGGTNFSSNTAMSSASQNFRVFWDGDLYDELLDGTTVTSWSGNSFDTIFTASSCSSINGSKSNPALQADLFGDWREELVYPTTNGTALRVFTTTTETDYKIKTLMQDPVYRSGVAAEQTAYNQPPHVGFYLSEDVFYGTLTGITVTPSTTTYYVGDEFSTDGLTVTANYSDADDRAVTDYSISGYDPLISGEQTITVKYLNNKATYTVNVIGESGIDVNLLQDEYSVGEEIDKSQFEVSLVYEDETTKTVTDFKISDYDSMKTGAQTVTVTYTGAQGTYTETAEVTVVSGIVIENGVVTGYSGTDEEIIIPLYDGDTEVESIAAGAFANSTASKIYIYSETIEFADSDAIFPDGITIVCYEGSTAQTYAEAHNITYEIIETGDEVTFEEDFYAEYAGGNLLMQSTSAAGTLADEFVTYNTIQADNGPWYKDNTFGFAINTDGDNNYLYVNAGIYDERNAYNQIYMTLNNPASTEETQTVSFDICFPTSANTPYVELQNDAGTVIDTLSASNLSLESDTWYTYELVYDGEGYTRNIYDSDGGTVSSTALSVTAGTTVLSTIAFKQDYVSSSQTAVVYIDNILIK